MFPPRCCNERIQLHHARKVLPMTMITRFAEKETEYGTPNRTYCHRCNTFIPPQIQDGNNEATARAVCPSCQAATCTGCKAESHLGACREDEHQGQLRRLTQEMNWKVCPSCNIVVERTGGCNHITCTCGHEFCYNCGMSFHACSCYGRPQPVVLHAPPVEVQANPMDVWQRVRDLNNELLNHRMRIRQM